MHEVSRTDPGSYDHDELEASILRGRLDVGLLRARAWCDDPQAMCMYADWLLHQAIAPEDGLDADELVDEARGWLRRAVRSGSLHAAGMLGDTLRLDLEADVADPAEARRWLMRAAARGDERSAELLASLDDLT
jgi:TPR repeat protein